MGCGDAETTTDDGGLDGTILPGRDARTWEDARTLPDARPPYPEECSRGDLFVQSECGGTRKCTVTAGNLFDGTAELGCAPAGDTPFYSPCVETLPDGVDDCEAGSVCADPYHTATSTCHPFCEQLDGFCQGGGVCLSTVRIAEQDPVYLCISPTPCDPVFDDGCDSGAAELSCYWAPGVGATVCLPAGQTQLGETCSSMAECEPMATCFGEPGDKRCRWVCDLGDGWLCNSDQNCIDVGDGDYGVCYP
jgi:hypothetical protein